MGLSRHRSKFGKSQRASFRRFTYVNSSFSNPSVALPMSQFILQPFRCFTYVTVHSPTLPLLHLRHSSFSNPSFASLTSQVLHLIHLASHPWLTHSARRTSVKEIRATGKISRHCKFWRRYRTSATA